MLSQTLLVSMCCNFLNLGHRVLICCSLIGGEKRKKSDDEDLDDRLEDEDYDLLEENLGVKVDRRV